MKVQVSSNDLRPGVAARDVAVASALKSLAVRLCEVLSILGVGATGDLPV